MLNHEYMAVDQPSHDGLPFDNHTNHGRLPALADISLSYTCTETENVSKGGKSK